MTNILIESSRSEDNHLKCTNSLIKLKDSGFEPVTELLDEEPFSNYLPLLENKGMYRSDKSYMKPMHDDDFINGLIGGDAERYVYLYISDEILSGSYYPEDQLARPITEEILKNHTNSSNYKSICTYIGNGSYYCQVEYTNSSFESQKYSESFNFEMRFENEKIIVSSLKTSETGTRISFIEGIYSKIN